MTKHFSTVDGYSQSFSKPNSTCCPHRLRGALLFFFCMIFSVLPNSSHAQTTSGCPFSASDTVIDLGTHSNMVFKSGCVLQDSIVKFKSPPPTQTATITVDGLIMDGGALFLLDGGDNNGIISGISVLVINTVVHNATSFFSTNASFSPRLVSASHISVTILNSTIDVPHGSAFSFEARMINNVSVVAGAGTNISANGTACSCAATDSASDINLHALDGSAVRSNGTSAFSIVRTGTATLPTFTVTNANLSVNGASMVEVHSVTPDSNLCVAVASVCSALPLSDANLVLQSVSLRVDVVGSASSVAATTLGTSNHPSWLLV